MVVRKVFSFGFPYFIFIFLLCFLSSHVVICVSTTATPVVQSPKQTPVAGSPKQTPVEHLTTSESVDVSSESFDWVDDAIPDYENVVMSVEEIIAESDSHITNEIEENISGTVPEVPKTGALDAESSRVQHSDARPQVAVSKTCVDGDLNGNTGNGCLAGVSSNAVVNPPVVAPVFVKTDLPADVDMNDNSISGDGGNKKGDDVGLPKPAPAPTGTEPTVPQAEEPVSDPLTKQPPVDVTQQVAFGSLHKTASPQKSSTEASQKMSILSRGLFESEAPQLSVSSSPEKLPDQEKVTKVSVTLSPVLPLSGGLLAARKGEIVGSANVKTETKQRASGATQITPVTPEIKQGISSLQDAAQHSVGDKCKDGMHTKDRLCDDKNLDGSNVMTQKAPPRPSSENNIPRELYVICKRRFLMFYLCDT